MPTIKDYTGQYTSQQLEELSNFVEEQLLASEVDLDWLDVIKIRKDGLMAGYYGYWRIKFDDNTPRAIIVLNASFLKTVEQLKRTLAHEYGHHWTLCYLAINHGLDVYNEPLPSEYYNIRGLSEDYCLYSPQQIQSPQDWMRCDKEIIAEDYRVLFSPHPHNQDHRMVGNPITHPNELVEAYIETLPETI